MKYLIKLITVLTFTLIVSSTSYAQWETVRWYTDPTPLPWLESISFTDINNGLGACSGLVSYYQVGGSQRKGGIIKTTDGGITWVDVLVWDSVEFKELIHTNPNTALCVGYDWVDSTGIIVKTSNSGLNWDTTVVPSFLYSISFPSNNVGYATGATGALLKTIDGGNNWIPLNSGVTDNIWGCTFINDSVGFVTTRTSVLKTSDGGANWTSQVFGSLDVRITDISFPSFDTGYFLILKTSGYNVYKTIDNGNNWVLVSTIINNNYHWISSMNFPTNQIGYMAGQFQMYKTINGGLNWYRQYSSPPALQDFGDDVKDLFFFNADTGYAAGWGDFYRTFKGGDSPAGVNKFNKNKEGILAYPNPFTESTTFTIPNHGRAYSLCLYNLHGQIVRKLENIRQPEIKLYKENLKQGMYLYRVMIGDEIIGDGKMIIK
jgi:photosystem II stability/assembly factor-like uncharacterized protein